MTLFIALLIIAAVVIGIATVTAIYVGTVTGALTVDTGWGRRLRPLGPLTVDIAADRDTVYALLTQPYLGRATRALREKVHVLERATDMVLAAHRTPIGGRLTAVTVETVRFTSPERIDFRLLRGPVPHVVEHFTLSSIDGDGTRLEYHGELGTDGWSLGAWWGLIVARRWQAAVEATVESVRAEAERPTRPGR
ncbi:SRPBCC family protein [Longispora sp. NPDC051575]|uniref:SRPBCC family protein n=1 Tax=Longispora sp. NPDC051575 TaxID=3154943 RepID=UPI00342937D0